MLFTKEMTETTSCTRSAKRGSRAQSYLAALREKREASRIVSTLTITPVQLTVRGFEESVGPTLTLVQTRDLQKP